MIKAAVSLTNVRQANNNHCVSYINFVMGAKLWHRAFYGNP